MIIWWKIIMKSVLRWNTSERIFQWKGFRKRINKQNFCTFQLNTTNIAKRWNRRVYNDSLNLKQREVFNVVHTWAKDSVNHDGHNVEPIHIFIWGSGGTGKSQLVKVIYSAISKTLLYHCKDPENSRVFYLGLQEYQR